MRMHDLEGVPAEVVPGHACVAFFEVAETGGVMCYSLYLVCGADLSERNWEILRQVGAHIKSHGKPWAIGGDWNLTLEILSASGWPKKIGGTILRGALAYTTFSGDKLGRLIDFHVVCNALAGAGESSADSLQAEALRTHLPVALWLPLAPKALTYQKSWAPKQFDRETVFEHFGRRPSPRQTETGAWRKRGRFKPTQP